MTARRSTVRGTARGGTQALPLAAPQQGFHELLVPVDLTPGSERVVHRAVLLPVSPRARITLMHVVPGSLPSAARRQAGEDATMALEREAAILQRELPPGVKVTVTVSVGRAADAIVAYAERMEPDLLVMGRGQRRRVQDFFLGSTTERVLRQMRLPVLVVRSAARTAYIRPAIAVDPEQTTDALLPLLRRVLPEPVPPVTVVHAYEVPFGGLLYPSLTVDDAGEVQDQFGRAAREEVQRHLLDAVERAELPIDETPRWRMHVRVGSPRVVIPRAVAQEEIDLLALCTRARRGVSLAFMGTVAGDVLRQVGCDVLVVPPAR
jgi:nucleotide-binding universal stress UspA family protein